MSATLTKLIILMAAGLPFCCASATGDETLNIEVWRRVWRVNNDSVSGGIYVNKFYHCTGTPIHQNVILTSARCINRLSVQSAIRSIYLYGNYNQTKTIIQRATSLFVKFLINPESQEFYCSSPMMFNVEGVMYHNFSNYYQPSNPNYAFLILKDPVYLNDGIDYVELLRSENLNDIDYKNCRIVSVNRDHSKREADAECELILDESNSMKSSLNCRTKTEGFSVIFDSGSPVYCLLIDSSKYLQVGLVSKYSMLFPSVHVFLAKPTFESVLDVTVPNIYGDNEFYNIN